MPPAGAGTRPGARCRRPARPASAAVVGVRPRLELATRQPFGRALLDAPAVAGRVVSRRAAVHHDGPRGGGLWFAHAIAAVQVVGEQAHALGDVLFHGFLADPQAHGHFLLRQVLDAAQPDHLAAAVGQAVEGLGQPQQSLPAAAPALRRHVIHQDVRGLEITHRLDRDHPAAAQAVGHQVPRAGEQERLRLGRQRPGGGLVDTCVDFLAQVVDLVAARPAALQVAHQRILVDEDFVDEPAVELGLHRGTIAERGKPRRRSSSNVAADDGEQGHTMMRRAGVSKFLVAALGLLLAGGALAADVGHYVIGDLAAKTPGKVQPGPAADGRRRPQLRCHALVHEAGRQRPHRGVAGVAGRRDRRGILQRGRWHQIGRDLRVQ
jgi:hypothetical protein